MEKRIRESVEDILLRYTEARSVDFQNSKGLQAQPSQLDALGFDVLLHLHNDKTMKVQVKCGRPENFETFGRERKSFTLGDPNDIFFDRTEVIPIKFYDLLLTGYEIEKGVLRPFTLINWPYLIKNVCEGKLTKGKYNKSLSASEKYKKIFINKNNYDGHQFAWAGYRRLIQKDLNLKQLFDISSF